MIRAESKTIMDGSCEKRNWIFGEIEAERNRQDAKFGEQAHEDYIWAAIAGEEFGEVCQAMLHTQFGGKAAGTTRLELLHLTAVCVSWLEAIDRRNP